MNDTTTVLVAAFAGGLAGAILQPLVAHAMDRLRAKDEREKVIEKHLRRTITKWLEFTTQAGRTAIEIAARRDKNIPALSAEEIERRIRINDHDFPSWEPERIRDPAMRSLAERLYELSVSLPLDLAAPDIETETLDRVAGEIGQLRKDIVQKMDALGWPQYED